MFLILPRIAEEALYIRAPILSTMATSRPADNISSD
jgi:hypothetical protein